MTTQTMSAHPLIIRYRIAMSLFIIGLVLSGVTAFPLLREVELLCRFLGIVPLAYCYHLSQRMKKGKASAP